jgi:hypothetical protein
MQEIFTDLFFKKKSRFLTMREMEKEIKKQKYFSMRRRMKLPISELMEKAIPHALPSLRTIENILNYARATKSIKILEKNHQLIVLN